MRAEGFLCESESRGPDQSNQTVTGFISARRARRWIAGTVRASSPDEFSRWRQPTIFWFTLSLVSVQPHDRFAKTVRLSEEEIRALATASGDPNPIHHDSEYAATTRYGGIVASGPQTTALLLGLTASYFSEIGQMVGLEFTTIFKAGVPANDDLRLEWLVIRTEPKRSGSILVDLRGRLRTSEGVTAVGAKGKILVTPN